MNETADLGTLDVAERTGVSLRQLNHWDQLGIIGPSTQPALGSGTRRRYTPHDLFLLLIASALRSAHAPLEFVREAISSVRVAGLGLDCPDPMLLVGARGSIAYLGSDAGRAMKAAMAGEIAYVANLAVHARRAVDMTARVALPQTRVIRIGGRAVQCIISPTSQGYLARCNAHPGRQGSGDSLDAAAEALRKAIEQVAPAGERPRSAQRSVEDSLSDGASSWGGEW